MRTISVSGKKPLSGSVVIGGSTRSALMFISGALFVNDDVILSNIPRSAEVLSLVDFIIGLGAKVEWLGRNKLLMNGKEITVYLTPVTSDLLPLLSFIPLMFRFGEVSVPTSLLSDSAENIKAFTKIARSFGVKIDSGNVNTILRVVNLKASEVTLDLNSIDVSALSIFLATYISGTSRISNISEDPIIEDLIGFFSSMGGDCSHISSDIVEITGTNVFREGSFAVSACGDEAILFAISAILTKGNVSIKGVEKNTIIAFVNILSKIGVGFEFTKNEFRVWPTGNPLQGTDIRTGNYPNLYSKWQPLVSLLLLSAEGTCKVCDHSNSRFDYIKDLNRMGARIALATEEDLGFCVTLAGPVSLRGTKLHIPSAREGLVLLLAALTADGRSEITGYECLEKSYPGIYTRLLDLGADIE